MSYCIILYDYIQTHNKDYFYVYIQSASVDGVPYNIRDFIGVAWPNQKQIFFHPPIEFVSKEEAEEFIEQKLNKSCTYKIVDTEEVLVNIAERKLRQL